MSWAILVFHPTSDFAVIGSRAVGKHLFSDSFARTD